jgi:hypothetical protein
MQKKWETPSRTSPKAGSQRGCYCKDKQTYDKKCCNGSLWAQGIGNISRAPQFTNVQWNGIVAQWQTIGETWNN